MSKDEKMTLAWEAFINDPINPRIELSYSRSTVRIGVDHTDGYLVIDFDRVEHADLLRGLAAMILDSINL